LQGFDIDISKVIAKGLFNDPEKVEFVVQGSDARIPNLLTDKVDISCQFITVTASRAQQVAFTLPYYREGVALLLPANSRYQQIDDLKAGRGMGLALAAELNGYPGPSHVLELSEKLALSPAQKERIQKLFESMKAESTPIGARLIEQEGALDQQFARRSITPDTLKEATTQIGATQAELRNAHLKYHLETAQILSPDQMRQYAELRGYTSGAPAQHHRMH